MTDVERSPDPLASRSFSHKEAEVGDGGGGALSGEPLSEGVVAKPRSGDADGSPAPSESGVSVEGHPWPRPDKRIVDGTAEPLDSSPIDENFCPICEKFTLTWERCHVVGRGVGGDDVQDNLFWACSICHMWLHSKQQDTDLHRDFVRYCRETVPELGAYADRKKYPGYIERRYLGV